MSELKHVINLVVGDWSHDGHGKTQLVTIRSSLSGTEIEEAYKNGVKIIGFDLIECVAANYEDSGIDAEYERKLRAAGVDLDSTVEKTYDRTEWSLWTDSYAELYLFFVKTGNPDFKFEFLNHDESNINIGGYGLFD